MIPSVGGNNPGVSTDRRVGVILADVESSIMSLRVAHLSDVIEASAVFQSQPLSCLPVVLAIESKLVRTPMTHRVRRELIISGQTSHKKVREGVSGRRPAPIGRLRVPLIIVKAGLYVGGQ